MADGRLSMPGKFKAAILVASDRAHQGIRADETGPILEKRLSDLGYDVKAIEVVPDDKKIINIKDDKLYYFGEMSMFDTNLKRSASIFARTNTKVAFLSKSDFENIIAKYPDSGITILKNIGLKLSQLLDRSNVELSKLITAFTMSLKL